MVIDARLPSCVSLHACVLQAAATEAAGYTLLLAEDLTHTGNCF